MRSTRALSVTVVAPPARKYAPGHYLAIGNGSGRRGTYYKTSGTAPNLLTLPGIQGVQLRYHWGDLETTQGTYTFGNVKSTYPDSERTIRADIWRCAQNNSRLVIMIEDKTFDGTHPAPTYLQSTQYELPNGSGYTMVRWNSFVQTRFHALLQALGNAFDASIVWYGVAVQETALNLSQTQRDNAGYTDVLYRDSIINNLKAASDYFPTSQIFWYQNFFPTPTSDYRLEEVADAVKGYNGGDHGIIMGGPDILPDSDPVMTRCYPRYRDPPDGNFGELKLFCSMQDNSYSHNHTTTTPDARMPGDTWTSGSLWTMDQLYRFGRDYLRLNYVMWNLYVGTGGWTFLTDGSNVVAANPTFNTNY